MTIQNHVVALAGGVGGARLAHGLLLALAANRAVASAQPGELPYPLSVVCNTADDFDLYSLRISPDTDTVLYTLAGLANPETGWGITGDTASALDMLGRYGEETWFWLGDRDLATHILRTERLRAGWSLSAVMQAFGQSLNVQANLLPMCDEPVATLLRTPGGELAFQDYFVRRRQAATVQGVRFAGIERVRIPDAVRQAITQAQAIIFCPSNPFVSIGPILAVPEMRDLIRVASAPKVAVSPIVGGVAIKGPAAAMLASLGHEVSAYGVATLYSGLIQGFVIDQADAQHATRIEALGMRVLVTDTIMRDLAGRERLARETLRFAGEL